MRKRIFLLLPEVYEDANPRPYLPTTNSLQRQNIADFVLVNVYEYFRMNHNKKEAIKMSMEMLPGFDELWYYGAFGITKPMQCILTSAKNINLPIKDLQPISCKSSFSLVYKFALEFHPSQTQDDTYWSKCIRTLGEYSKDNNPLNGYLFQEIVEYFEKVYRKEAPAVPAEDLFKGEFRTALNFAVWAMKKKETFNDGIDPAKVSKNPTPMLIALLNGFYRYYQARQTTLEMNKEKGEK